MLLRLSDRSFTSTHLKSKGHGTSSVLEHLLEGHWVVGSTAPGGPVEILLAQLCNKAYGMYSFCQWDNADKRSLAANWKE